MARREIRCQAAVIADARLLLLRCEPHAGGAFWLLPGGGQEAGETEEACVQREVREEAGLEVVVDALLYDVPADPPDGTYARWRTYACSVTGGTAAASGGEREADLVAIRWLPLNEPETWKTELCGDAFLYPQLERIRVSLASLSSSLGPRGGAT